MHTASQALSGQLDSSHPAAAALAALPWLLPLHSERSAGGASERPHSSDAGYGVAPQRGQDEALQPATAAEVESLLAKLSALCVAMGIRYVMYEVRMSAGRSTWG